ncbi:hypothetical protein ACHAWO_013549 [Cyclotella atomus]|uniref:Uncharacterized protein n=1 Tax=Cyclotella atomus TaxID=382360 RepID=A0ABD3PRS2_9STRA
MVKLKSYTPEERAERRKRTSIIERPALTNATEDFDESWFHDLRHQGVDIEEFLKDVIEPCADGDVDDSSTSSDVQGVTKRLSRLSVHQKHQLMRKLSSFTDNTVVKDRFSSFFGQSYEYDPITGEPVLLSVEEIQKRKWEKEVEEDSRHFDPKGSSAEARERNKQWAIEMARKHVIAAGFEPEIHEEVNSDDCSQPEIETEMPAPPPAEPLPPVEELNLGPKPETSLGPRSIGITPPLFPHKLTDIIPKHDLSDLVGIPTGAVVDGSLGDGWTSCDATTMLVSCMNDECTSYLRCPRFTSLVRCSVCNAVSPATCLPLPDQGAARMNGNSHG